MPCISAPPRPLRMDRPLLTLQGVWSGYGRTTVLEGVDLAVAPREAVAIIGRNGAGKTTLLETVMGHLPLARGAMRLRDADLASVPAHARAALGIAYRSEEHTSELQSREKLVWRLPLEKKKSWRPSKV